jgi:hypothetical protein
MQQPVAPRTARIVSRSGGLLSRKVVDGRPTLGILARRQYASRLVQDNRQRRFDSARLSGTAPRFSVRLVARVIRRLAA